MSRQVMSCYEGKAMLYQVRTGYVTLLQFNPGYVRLSQVFWVRSS
jgi:hypothetical protein